MNIPPARTGFGATLARWGVHPGPYLVLPLLGPYTLRDGFGLRGRLRHRLGHQLSPPVYQGTIGWVVTPVAMVDTRANTDFRYYGTGSVFEYDDVRFLYVRKTLIQDDAIRLWHRSAPPSPKSSRQMTSPGRAVSQRTAAAAAARGDAARLSLSLPGGLERDRAVVPGLRRDRLKAALRRGLGAFSCAAVVGLHRGHAPLGAAGLCAGLCGGAARGGARSSPPTSASGPMMSPRSATGRCTGDAVTLHNVRNFAGAATPTTRSAGRRAATICDSCSSVDMITSYWSSRAIAHLLFSFGFADGQHVVFSVEIRRERGEAYNEIGGFFKEFELSVIAADERDIIRVRTNVRGEDDYLYRLRLPRGGHPFAVPRLPRAGKPAGRARRGSTTRSPSIARRSCTAC